VAQDCSSNSLKTTAVATSRVPCFKFYVDWNDAGFTAFEASASAWTDESAYVQSIRGEHQATDWQRSVATVGRGVADVVYVTCRNPEESGSYSGLRFSPSNTGGSLYSNASYGGGTVSDLLHGRSAYSIGEGYGMMKRAVVMAGYYNGATAEYLRQVTGYITNITENYRQRTVTFEIRDRAADAAFTRASTTLYPDTTAKAYLEALCALMDRDAVATADQQFDDGMMVIPYAWLDDETLWDEMHLVAESQMGRLWFDKDGDLHFEDGSHWVKAGGNAWDDPTISQATFTTASFADLSPIYDPGAIFNHVIAEYQPRYVGTLQTIYSDSEMHTIRPEVSTGSNVKTLKAEFRYPVSSIVDPVASTDFEATTAGARNITTSVTMDLTAYAAMADLEITNAHDYFTAFMTKLQLRGCPLLTEQSMKYEAEDSGSIAYFGRRTFPLRQNPYVQTYRHAQMIADFLLSRFKEPVQRVSLKGVPARPWLEVGDRITVTETLTDIDEDYFIVSIKWVFDGAGGYVQSIDAIRCSDLFPYTDYFTIGTSVYGSAYYPAGSPGRLFW